MQQAVAYHERHQAQAVVASVRGEIVLERYDNGFAESKPHALYSGTKSFWGPAALAAQRDGYLTLDERVAETFPAWAHDPRKATVTLRQLLSLTAGLPFGGLGMGVPMFAKALATELRADPGSTFTYGGIPLQIFGAVFTEKLRGAGITPHDFLRTRVLDPAGATVASWRTLADGTHPFPTGAFLTAHNWLRYGAWVLERYDELTECFQGTAPNPRYGLGWWLAPAGVPGDVVYASGSGGQALYILPSARTAIVRFGAGGSFKHDAFLKRWSA